MRSLDLRSAIFSARRAIATFLLWWGEALAACVPWPIRKRIQKRSRKTIVEVGSDAVHVRACVGPVEQGSVRIPFSGEGQLAPKLLDDAVRLAKFGSSNVSLAENQIYRRRLTLPVSAEPDLDKILTHEISRHTPFSADQVYFDFRVMERMPKRRQIAIELILAKRSVVDRTLQLADRLHIHVAKIGASSSALGRGDIDFLRWSKRRPARSTMSRATCGLAVAAVVLGLTYAWLSFASLDAKTRDLSVRAEAARAEFIRAEGLRREIQRLLNQELAIRGTKDSASPLALMQELTARLPDQVWVYQIQISNKEVRFAGFAPDAPAIIGLLQGSKTFGNPQFRSPVTRTPNTTVDRFDLSLAIAPRGKP